MIKPVVILTIVYSLCSCGAEQQNKPYIKNEYSVDTVKTDDSNRLKDEAPYALNYSTVMSLIKQEAEMGNQQLKTPFKIKQSAKDSLIKQGYVIGTVYNVHSGVSYTTISWY